MLNEADLMKLLSISGHYRGFPYLLDCANLAMADENLLHSMATNLYPRVAERHNTTVAHVASSIRTVVRLWWQRGNRSFALPYLTSLDTPPGNKAFIHALVAHLQRQAEKAD